MDAHSARGKERQITAREAALRCGGKEWKIKASFRCEGTSRRNRCAVHHSFYLRVDPHAARLNAHRQACAEDFKYQTLPQYRDRVGSYLQQDLCRSLRLKGSEV